jgi:translation initiation factor IF-2
MRINEIAREHNIENKAIISWLESIGVKGKSHSSSVDPGTLDMLLQHFGKAEIEEKEDLKAVSKRFAKVKRPKGWTPRRGDPIDEKEHVPTHIPQPGSAVMSPEAQKSSPQRPIMRREQPTTSAPAATPQQPVSTSTPTSPPPENPMVQPQSTHGKEVQPVGEQPKQEVQPERPIESTLVQPQQTSVQKPPQTTVQPPQQQPAQPVVKTPPVEKTVEDQTKPHPQTHPPKPSEEIQSSAPVVPTQEKQSDKHPKDKKQGKKQKYRTLSLEAAKEMFGQSSSQTRTEEQKPAKKSKVKQKDHKDHSTPKDTKPKDHSKHDEDEAIRREIQKLKIKQSATVEPEEETIVEEEIVKVDKVVKPQAKKPTRRRPTDVKSRGKRAWKKEKKERREQQIAAEEERQEREKTILKVHEATTCADVADGLDIPVTELIQKLISLGVMATINQPLDVDTIQIIADEYNFEVEEVDIYDNDVLQELWKEDTDESRMSQRPPVVTIMGHVDHGKTKLLDAVRESDVVSSEAGGITQHIGAYYVKTPAGTIVFLDTPGHEAFTAMRARGAMVTDIVILVVSAADGVMPQTIEAIHHAKAAGVPIIVAINKIDLEGANQDRVKQQLAEKGLTPEDWGGDVITVPISAKQKIGIEDLIETIVLQSEMLELKADPECRARGTIIEGRLEQGRGPVATVLIQQGKLQVGDPFVTGVYSGRIRAMYNERGEPMEVAGPSMPVEILGIEDVPSAGDPFISVEDDNQAKQISARLQQIQRERDMKRTHHVTLDDLHSQIMSGEIKDLFVIVKGDVQGSVGAVCESLTKIESDKVKVQIIHSGVGAISESDVMLASASNAIIIGFNVRPHPQVTDLAKREHVDIRTYRIIYNAIEDVKNAMTGMLDKTFKENVLGHGEVREVFRLSKGLSIAGLFIQDGKLLRNAPVRLLRDSVVVHEGKLSSLKRFKDDVKEVAQGYECGIGLENFNDIREGDVVECYQLDEVAPTL